MKMSKRMKIIIAIGVIIIGAVIISCANLGKNVEHVGVTPQSIANWKTKAPDLFNNVGYSKLIASLPVTNKKTSGNMLKLQGTITNPLGIRDDILDYIINNVPQDNPLVVKAAIKIAQADQQIYYGDVTKEEALLISKNQILAEICLYQYLGNTDITRKMHKLLRNTKAREDRMWDVARKYFSWEMLGTGYTVVEENKRCNQGDF